MPDTAPLELYAETPHETGEPAMPILHTLKFVATESGAEALVRAAVAHAEAENLGDGDYVLRDAGGRRVGWINVRAGQCPAITFVPPGPSPAEELLALYEDCPLCDGSAVLVPCCVCGVRRCVRCLAGRRCCNPEDLPGVDLDAP